MNYIGVHNSFIFKYNLSAKEELICTFLESSHKIKWVVKENNTFKRFV
jgi:hypothetical protein